MDEDLHNIEDLFYSALDDNEEIPSPSVWNGVEKRLDKDNIISIKKKYTNLKRIAILLLLLLGISIYEMNTIHNSSNLSKNKNSNSNSNSNSKNQQKTSGNVDKALNKKNGNDSKKLFERGIINNTNKGKTAFTNSVQKQNTIHRINSEKNILKDQTFINSSTQTRLTSEPFNKIKFKNTNPNEGESLTVQNNNEQTVYQSPLPKQKNLWIENIILQSKNPIDLQKSRYSIAISKAWLIDQSNNNIIAIVQKKHIRTNRFSITPFFSPDIAWYRLQDNNFNNQPGNSNDIEREEKHEFSSTYGALVDYKINKHWGLQSGITLSNINIITEPEIIYAQPDNSGNVKYRVNNSSGYGYILPSFSSNPVIGDSLYAFTSTHSLRYIGIPIAVTYSFVKNKFTLSVIAGMSNNFLTKAKLETSVEKGPDNSVETVNSIQGLKKVFLSGLAGIGIDFKLNKKISVGFAPTMRFALNSINKNVAVKSFPMSFGSSVGLRIGL